MTDWRERFDRYCMPEPMSGCWLWIGPLCGAGYGRMTIGGERPGAHRLSYELFVGPIPEGLELDHLCRTRCCVNPDHLEPVTQRENGRRGFSAPAINARKTHCPEGHPLSGDNVRIDGHTRRCVTCYRAYRRRRWKLGLRVRTRAIEAEATAMGGTEGGGT